MSASATITDFIHGTDVLQISAAGFGHGLSAGSSAPLVTAPDLGSAFSAGSNGYFIFDNSGTNAGTLYWDANGGDGTDAIALVYLNNVDYLNALAFSILV